MKRRMAHQILRSALRAVADDPDAEVYVSRDGTRAQIIGWVNATTHDGQVRRVTVEARWGEVRE